MTDSQAAVETFIDYWSPTGGGERSNYQRFLNELCDLSGAPGRGRLVALAASEQQESFSPDARRWPVFGDLRWA